MAVLAINGVQVVSPSTLTVDLERRGNSAVTADGARVYDLIANKHTLSAAWSYIGASDAHSILAMVTATPFFAVQYYDPYTGETVTGTFTTEKITQEAGRYTAGQPEYFSFLKITMEEK